MNNSDCLMIMVRKHGYYCYCNYKWVWVDNPMDNNKDDLQELEKIFDVPFTFSVNCCCGITERCECWRCRERRREKPDEELAKRVAIVARAKYEASMREFLAEMNSSK